MKKLTYSEQLKDPRWQKKRLEILNRDSFMCQSCGDEENTLHVHHLAYLNDRQLWDIDNQFLITLCASCHESVSCDYEYAKSWLMLSTYDSEIIGGIGYIIELLYNCDPTVIEDTKEYIKNRRKLYK